MPSSSDIPRPFHKKPFVDIRGGGRVRDGVRLANNRFTTTNVRLNFHNFLIAKGQFHIVRFSSRA